MKFISKIRATLTVTAVIATVAMVPQGAYAQSLEEVYKGNTITIGDS